MGGFLRKIGLFRLLAVASSGAMLISCASISQLPLTKLGTPGHHVYTGIRLLDQNKYADAGREFEIALKISPGYPKAYAGLGLVSAFKGDFRGGLAFLEQSEKLLTSDEERTFFGIAVIRFNTLRHIACERASGEFCGPEESSWLKNSIEAFNRAVQSEKAADAYYFMAAAYLQAFELQEAAKMFQMVIDLEGGYLEEAGTYLELIRRIREANPGTAIGKRVACVPEVNRAEVAALFCDELGIENLIRKRASGHFEETIKSPAPSDISGCRLRSYIEDIRGAGIKGLQVYPDGSFRPGDLVNRADYAVMIEDIIVKISGEKTARLKIHRSPFYDVPSDQAFFDEVMFVTSRGFMEPVGRLSGSFAPFEQLSGVDAVFAIRKIKEYLQIE
jgi:hypothetical protein